MAGVRFLVALGGDEYAGTRTVTIHRTAFTARFPCFDVQAVYQFLVHIVRQVNGYADGVIHPF